MNWEDYDVINIPEDKYLEACIELLEKFNKDLSKDIIEIHSGDNSCIMNKNSKFYTLFGGQSVRSVAQYVAEKLNKQLKYKE
jgi:hypothetical protein